MREALAVDDPERVRVPLGLRVKLAVIDRVSPDVIDGVTAPLGVGVPLRVPEGVSEGVADGVADSEADVLGLVERLALPLGVPDAERVRVSVWEGV